MKICGAMFLFLALCCCVFASDYLDPVVESRLTESIAVKNLVPGEDPAEVVGDTLVMKATGTTASSAALPGRYDFSKGIKFTFEVKPDLVQSNPFPRVLEGEMLSVHFTNPPGKAGNWEFKVLSQGPDGPSQARTFVPVDGKKWHNVTVRADAARRMLSIQVDGMDEVKATLPADFLQIRNSAVYLGNINGNRNSSRGFCGAIRNLKVVYPYAPDRPLPDFAVIGPSEKPLSHKGVPIEYLPAIRMPKRNFYFPGFAVLKDGSLACAAREAEYHVCPYGRIVFARTASGMENWSVPVCLADNFYDLRDPGLLQLEDGRLLLTYRDALSWEAKDFPAETAFVKASGIPFNRFYYCFSNDNGMTWETPVLVPGFSPHGPAFYKGSFYQPNIDVRDGRRYIDLLKGSADAGKWEKISTIAESPTQDPGTIQEPHLAVLADGTMLCAIRIHTDGYMRISRSTDGGKTWSKMEKTVVRGYPQHLLPLPDGRILATYGYRYYPMGVRACFSYDGGKTWDIKNEVIIRDRGTHGDLGYAVSAILPDGRIATAYYYNSREYPACHVEVAIWKP